MRARRVKDDFVKSREERSVILHVLQIDAVTKISGNLVAVNAMILKQTDEPGGYRFSWWILPNATPIPKSIPQAQTRNDFI
jgi:hypothetical protein